MSLGRFISEQRERRGLSQRDLANLASVALQTLRDIEQDRRGTINLETARRLARALGVSVDQLADAAREKDFEPAVA